MGEASHRFHSHFAFDYCHSIDKISFCLGKRDTGRGSLYRIMGFGKIHNYFLLVHNSNVTQLQFEL